MVLWEKNKPLCNIYVDLVSVGGPWRFRPFPRQQDTIYLWIAHRTEQVTKNSSLSHENVNHSVNARVENDSFIGPNVIQ